MDDVDVQPQRNSPEWERLLDKPRIYVDLNGGGRVGDHYVVPLNSSTTSADLLKHEITLKEKLVLDFWTDDGDENGRPDPLIFSGIIHFDEELKQWAAIVNWGGFQHASEQKSQKETHPTVREDRLITTGDRPSARPKVLS